MVFSTNIELICHWQIKVIEIFCVIWSFEETNGLHFLSLVQTTVFVYFKVLFVFCYCSHLCRYKDFTSDMGTFITRNNEIKIWCTKRKSWLQS